MSERVFKVIGIGSGFFCLISFSFPSSLNIGSRFDRSLRRGAHRRTRPRGEQTSHIYSNRSLSPLLLPYRSHTYTGFQSKELIVSSGLNVGDVDQYPTIDVTIDGADE
jgi:hypothetical protein